jgi:predicted ATP-grasp superfamily ATP-dependent carboligase
MGLGVIRALGRMGVPVVAVHFNPKDMGYTSRYVTEAIHTVHPEHHEDEFLDTLTRVSRKYPDAVLFPVSDEALEAVSRRRHYLSRWYTVACAEWDIVRRMLSKEYTYSLAEEIGVATPCTLTPHSEEEAEAYSRALQYPCLVKPTLSHQYFEIFRTKMLRVENPDQLLKAYREAEAARQPVMLQELIPGDDSHVVNYNSYFWKGRPLVEFTARQIRKAPPLFGSPCVAKYEHIPEILEPGRKLLEALGFYGYSCMELKLDPRTGAYILMEVNARHNLSTLLAVTCGVNFPWLHYRHLAYGEQPAQQEISRQLYWIDLTRDISHSPRQFRLNKAGFSRRFIKPYISRHVFAVLDLRDLKPFITRLWQQLSGGVFLHRTGQRDDYGKVKT